ncbi:MAG: hypothetical protein ACYDAO_02525 [Thermoplasmataceae archaeon]
MKTHIDYKPYTIPLNGYKMSGNAKDREYSCVYHPGRKFTKSEFKRHFRQNDTDRLVRA